MLADSNGIPQGPSPDANQDSAQTTQRTDIHAVSQEQSGEVRFKRRKRHRRRHRTKTEKRLYWDIFLGGAVLTIIVLLLFAISKSGPAPLPLPPIQEAPAGR
ncbi:MAG TPA: hypothetical protein VH619_05205 [Verrucomicrobiae bacterium]|jgi:hypothetical protein|nr:hypothetical protein [Verrucomicrobiae bacterium]